MAELAGVEAERFSFLLESDKLTENEKSRYRALTKLQNGRYSMLEELLISALQILSQLLMKHYGQKAIILIDEYDVPLDKAYQNGKNKQLFTVCCFNRLPARFERKYFHRIE